MLIGIFSGIYLFASDTIRPLAGVWGEPDPYHFGTFNTDTGNTGKIEFGLAPTNSWTYSWAALISNSSGSTLSGYFWIGTIGWVSFENVDFIPSGGAPLDPYTLSWWIWSDYAGWINASWVVWDPDNTSFSGYAWNDGIGWINFAGATLGSISTGLVGKVKVLWNLGGSQILDTTYNIKNTSIQGTTMNNIINSIHKNVSLMLRNLPADKINTDFTTSNPNISGDKIIFVNTGSITQHVNFWSGGIFTKFNNVADPVRSLVVVGWDIYIDQAVFTHWTPWVRSKAIITLKNTNGVGGNIYINGNVTKVVSSLIAEWGVFSAYFPSSTATGYTYYNATATWLLTLPDRQLYIDGSVISHNTIGGAYGKTSGYICPFIETNCTASNAIRYDFNYFRDFQKNKPWSSSLRGYKNSTYDDYSVVIEYDPRVVSDPPPGLATVK